MFLNFTNIFFKLTDYTTLKLAFVLVYTITSLKHWNKKKKKPLSITIELLPVFVVFYSSGFSNLFCWWDKLNKYENRLKRSCHSLDDWSV